MSSQKENPQKKQSHLKISKVSKILKAKKSISLTQDLMKDIQLKKKSYKIKDNSKFALDEGDLGFNTSILHADIRNRTGQGAIHQGIQPSVTFGYQDVKDLIEVFQNRKKGYVYSRNSSPSVAALERQITLLEGGRSSLVFSTGLAAITAAFISLLKAGDHIVASRYLFGNTHSFFMTLIRMGFEVDFVDTCNAMEVKRAFKLETKFFFAETIANPGTQIPDWKGISKVLKQHERKGRKIVSFIDNTLTTPYLFRPQEWGFSFSVNSLTKYMAGQGSVLAGSLTDLGNWKGNQDENILSKYKKLQPRDCQMMQIRKKGMRDLGPTLSPYAAHFVSLGLETLSLRMEKHMRNAQMVADFLFRHPRVKAVYYPGLKTHPQFTWAQEWYRGKGAILSFILDENKKESSWRKNNRVNKSENSLISFFNALRLIIKSSHLGDTRTLAIPVAKTIFHEMGPELRQEAGIDENQIRLSIGIEDLEDIIADIAQALEKI